MSLPLTYAPLREVLEALPMTLRSRIVGYLERVDEQVPNIFDRASVAPSDERRERFLFACAVRKVWVMVDSQYWTVTNAVAVMRRFDLREAAIGSARYGPSTPDYESVRRLRAEFSAQIETLGLSELVFTDSLSDLAQAIG